MTAEKQQATNVVSWFSIQGSALGSRVLGGLSANRTLPIGKGRIGGDTFTNASELD
jgi:hypothetical protein